MKKEKEITIGVLIMLTTETAKVRLTTSQSIFHRPVSCAEKVETFSASSFAPLHKKMHCAY